MVSCVTILPVPGANGGACACFTLHTIPHGSALPRPGGHAHTPLPGTNTSLAPSAASEIREIRAQARSPNGPNPPMARRRFAVALRRAHR